MKPQSNAFRGLVYAIALGLFILCCTRLMAYLYGGTALLILAARAYRASKPLLHRVGAALVLLFCHPRPIDGPLYTLCNPDHA